MGFQNGSLRLFRLLGVDVHLHWSWLLIAAFEVMRDRSQGIMGGRPHSVIFHIVVYVSLFAIVLVHEFGHALACKSVGGKAERIVLWPLGGLAFVQPPQRAGALLWSIAAGPLVNVVLLPLTIGPAVLLSMVSPDAALTEYLVYMAVINATLLVFNMLPFYPLDGGQILRALLWFAIGRGMSLTVAGVIGVGGAIVLVLLAIWMPSVWLAVLAAFMGLSAFAAIRQGLMLQKIERGVRRPETACPKCGEHPPLGPYWNCSCGARFDTFQTGGQCSSCGKVFDQTMCALCGEMTPLMRWYPGGMASFAAASAQWHAPVTTDLSGDNSSR